MTRSLAIALLFFSLLSFENRSCAAATAVRAATPESRTTEAVTNHISPPARPRARTHARAESRPALRPSLPHASHPPSLPPFRSVFLFCAVPPPDVIVADSSSFNSEASREDGDDGGVAGASLEDGRTDERRTPHRSLVRPSVRPADHPSIHLCRRHTRLRKRRSLGLIDVLKQDHCAEGGAVPLLSQLGLRSRSPPPGRTPSSVSKRPTVVSMRLQHRPTDFVLAAIAAAVIVLSCYSRVAAQPYLQPQPTPSGPLLT